MIHLTFILEFVKENLSLFIAALAVFFSFYNGYLQRKYSRLSSKPELILYFEAFNNKPTTVNLRNVGLGPAKIIKLQYFLKEVLVKDTEDEFAIQKIMRSLNFIDPVDYQLIAIEEGATISHNSSICLLEINSITPPSEINLANLLGQLSNIRLYIEYESIYEKRYGFNEVFFLKFKSIRSDDKE